MKNRLTLLIVLLLLAISSIADKQEKPLRNSSTEVFSSFEEAGDIKSPYAVTFNVSDGSNPLEGIMISVNDEMLTTDVNGSVTIDLLDGNFFWIAASTDYLDSYGTLTVNGEETSVSVIMELIPNGLILSQDDFEDYAAGDLVAENSNYWETWSGSSGGGADDAAVTDVFANSPTQSLLIADGGSDDMIFPLGGKTSGLYKIAFYFYVESGADYEGYFNFQGTTTPGDVFAFQNYFLQDGTADLNVNGGVIYNYTQDSWELMEIIVDLDNNYASFRINGNYVTSWEYTEGLGSINFYAGADSGTPKYYIDDIVYKDLNFSGGNVAFNVTDSESNPLEGANISINGENLITNVDGLAFIPIENGTYVYTVSLVGYTDYESSIIINNEDVTINVVLNLKRSATFNIDVSDSPDFNSATDRLFLSGSTVDGLEGIGVFDPWPIAQSEAGLELFDPDEDLVYSVTITDIDPGAYKYKYFATQGMPIVTAQWPIEDTLYFTIKDQDVTINDTWSASQFILTFEISDGASAISGAEININSRILTTDQDGIARIALPNGTYDYEVSYIGYDTVSNQVVVLDNAVTESVAMVESLYVVTFNVSDYSGSIDGAQISINSQVLVTDAAGIATVELTYGTYPYEVSFAGNETFISEVVVHNNVIQNITMLQYHTVIFNVSDGSNPIDGAEITINSQVLATGTDGVATIDLLNGTYSYEVTYPGYDTYTNQVIIQNAGLTENITIIESTYITTFNVSDESGPVEGAEINIDGQVLVTDASGIATIELINGTYNYDVSHASYNLYSSSVVVQNVNQTIDIALELLKYDVTFSVTDGTNPIEGATVSLEGVPDQITDVNGQVVFIDMLPDINIPYAVSAPGYIEETGMLTIVDSNVNVDLTLSLLTYQVTFVVDDGSDKIIGAEVSLSGYGTQLTNALGEAIFTDVSPEADIEFVVIADGFINYNDLVTVTNEDLSVNVSMSPVGVNDHVIEGFSLYPNPGSGRFNVSISGNAQVRIINMNGVEVFNNMISESELIDLSNNPTGIYIVLVHQGNKSMKQRIIIK